MLILRISENDEQLQPQFDSFSKQFIRLNSEQGDVWLLLNLKGDNTRVLH